MNPKKTRWRKSRKFGDVYGGRNHRKIPDRIWQRLHSLSPLADHEETPIFRVDNPSRDFFFPLSVEEITRELTNLPKNHWATITHIWLRRAKTSEYKNGEIPFAEFICGSGVRAVVLYPWPVNLKLYLGTKPPPRQVLKSYSNYTTDLQHDADGWHLNWSYPSLKNFYVESLLFHEIGHNLDWYNRHWSKANQRQIEEFANQYAYERTSMRSFSYM